MQQLIFENREQLQATNKNQYPLLCLLLEDYNIRRVLLSDLLHNSSVKTMYGAIFDMPRSWVAEKLSRTPTNCVIYCGINNILHESRIENNLDNLGALVSDRISYAGLITRLGGWGDATSHSTTYTWCQIGGHPHLVSSSTSYHTVIKYGCFS